MIKINLKEFDIELIYETGQAKTLNPKLHFPQIHERVIIDHYRHIYQHLHILMINRKRYLS